MTPLFARSIYKRLLWHTSTHIIALSCRACKAIKAISSGCINFSAMRSTFSFICSISIPTGARFADHNRGIIKRMAHGDMIRQIHQVRLAMYINLAINIFASVRSILRKSTRAYPASANGACWCSAVQNKPFRHYPTVTVYTGRRLLPLFSRAQILYHHQPVAGMLLP